MPNPMDSLQKLINKKALKQATTEWGELEKLIDAWFKEHPSKFSQLRRNRPEDYRSSPTPLMLLSTFPASLHLEEPLAKLASEFVKDRTEILAEQMAEDIMQKTALLP